LRLRMIVELIDPDLLELAPRFLHLVREDLKELSKARSAGDLATLARLGHSLKGAGAGFGFRTLDVIGQRIEAASKAADLDEVDAQLASLEAYLSTVRVEPAG
jgi:HPt (histidine-containing phosphotransfer) domain-containing protein